MLRVPLERIEQEARTVIDTDVSGTLRSLTPCALDRRPGLRVTSVPLEPVQVILEAVDDRTRRLPVRRVILDVDRAGLSCTRALVATGSGWVVALFPEDLSHAVAFRPLAPPRERNDGQRADPAGRLDQLPGTPVNSRHRRRIFTISPRCGHRLRLRS